jgi:hypothetical protein
MAVLVATQLTLLAPQFKFSTPLRVIVYIAVIIIAESTVLFMAYQIVFLSVKLVIKVNLSQCFIKLHSVKCDRAVDDMSISILF